MGSDSDGYVYDQIKIGEEAIHSLRAGRQNFIEDRILRRFWGVTVLTWFRSFVKWIALPNMLATLLSSTVFRRLPGELETQTSSSF